MKVVLTAFQGKLKSEFMDWPDYPIPPLEIRMRLDIANQVNFGSKEILPHMLTEHICRFVQTGMYYPIPGQRSAIEYMLVEIS